MPADSLLASSEWVAPWTALAGKRCWRSQAGFERCCAAAGVASCDGAPELADRCCDFPGGVALESTWTTHADRSCWYTELLGQDVMNQEVEGPAWLQQRNALVISLTDTHRQTSLALNFSDLDAVLSHYPAAHLGVILDVAGEQTLNIALKECRNGLLSLRLAGTHGSSRTYDIAAEAISDPWPDLIQSGWPVFLLLALRLRQKSQKRSLAEDLPDAKAIQTAIKTIKMLASMSLERIGTNDQDGSAWSVTRKVLETVQQQVLTQSSLKEAATRSVKFWHALHSLQEVFVLHALCPEASLAFPATIDGHSFRMCARASDKESVGSFLGYSPIDDAVVRQGLWRDCAAPARLFPQDRGLEQACIAIDVGANIGVCTLLLAQLGHPVIALEPDTSNYNLLQASLSIPQSNGVPLAKRVSLVHIAADSQDGMATMGRPRFNAGNSYLTRWRDDEMNIDGWIKDIHYSMVPTSRLDDIAAAHVQHFGGTLADICLMKVDVEGAEQRVFSGASEVLKVVRGVVFELNPVRTGAVDAFYVMHKVSQSGLTLFGLIPPAEQREIKPAEFLDFISMLLDHPEGETTMAALRI